MQFIRKRLNTNMVGDTVFQVIQKCKADPCVDKVNGTIGMLHDDNKELVTLSTVYKEYDAVSWKDKASYAQGVQGNASFIKAVEDWYIPNITLPHFTIATPSGSAAVSTCLKNYTEENDAVIIPNITWDPYHVMFEQYCLKPVEYEIIVDNKLNLKGIKSCVEKIKDKQHNILIIINDPCHNPTGYSMSLEEWQELLDYASSLKNNNVIILNDVAYIDYSYRSDAKEYIKLFNKIPDNVLIAMAVSFSKSMTAYGMRMGAVINIAKNKEDIDEIGVALKKTARGVWSNCNNGAMICFTNILNNPANYLKEKQQYIDLVKRRSDLFLKLINDKKVPIYCFHEGFFITLDVRGKFKDELFERLIASHIYLVNVKEGIRVGICSLPYDQIEFTVNEIAKHYHELKEKY